MAKVTAASPLLQNVYELLIFRASIRARHCFPEQAQSSQVLLFLFLRTTFVLFRRRRIPGGDKAQWGRGVLETPPAYIPSGVLK